MIISRSLPLRNATNISLFYLRSRFLFSFSFSLRFLLRVSELSSSDSINSSTLQKTILKLTINFNDSPSRSFLLQLSLCFRLISILPFVSFAFQVSCVSLDTFVRFVHFVRSVHFIRFVHCIRFVRQVRQSFASFAAFVRCVSSPLFVSFFHTVLFGPFLCSVNYISSFINYFVNPSGLYIRAGSRRSSPATFIASRAKICRDDVYQG